MKRMLNEAAAFREEMIAGYAAAYGRYLQRVPGASGVMANGAPAPGRVAVVVGGGSGHYPAFYGLVGQGLASGAAIGDIFTSPSGEQCYRVAKAVDGGAGILFTFGNYSGDVMNFGMAETRLRAEGVDARTVLVTDDVLSASPEEADRRRGIAGGFFVFKSAGASAARGDSLDDVEALTRHANSRVRTAGVAFAGCTVPGQDRAALHRRARADGDRARHPRRAGGARRRADAGARDCGDAGRNAARRDACGGRERGGGAGQRARRDQVRGDVRLLQRRRRVARPRRFAAVHPLIGEFVTSLDMTGMSLSLFWLDDELKIAPRCDRVFAGVHQHRSRCRPRHRSPPSRAPATGIATPAASDAVREDDDMPGGEIGEQRRAALRQALATIEEMESELGRLDAAAGDGDHGAGMVRGLRAAVEAIDGFDGTARQTFMRGGTAFQNAAGGASGALVGAWLIAIGTGLPEQDEAVDAAALAVALDQALATLQRLGQAQPGDKTMVDTLAPFSAALNQAAAERNGAFPGLGRRRCPRRRPGCSRRSTWSAAVAAPRASASAPGASRTPGRHRSTMSCTPFGDRRSRCVSSGLGVCRHRGEHSSHAAN